MFDFKKVFKVEYAPDQQPQIIKIPKIKYLAVSGMGDPNQADGEYQKSIELLYPIAYGLKMSYKTDYKIENFIQYVVPPLEGLWWIPNLKGMDYQRKHELRFISLLRLPDFITIKHVEDLKAIISKKKKMDFSKVEYFEYDEELCVQMLHIGPYDSEPETVEKMHVFMDKEGYTLDFSERMHHEIYLSDPRKTSMDKLKTIIRHPIKRK